MFKCQKCGGHSNPSEKMLKIVIKKRPRKYRKYNCVSVGWEIVKEISVCVKCK